MIIQRYTSTEIIDHLASNYVMGLLNPSVARRVDQLRAQPQYNALEQRIEYWEGKLSPLDDSTPELPPKPQSWTIIQQRLNHTDNTEHSSSPQGILSKLQRWFSPPRLAMAFSIVVCTLVINTAFFETSSPELARGSLSYIAVLEDQQQTPQVVASSFSESKTLVLDILNLPALDDDQSYELWVTSKSDNQTRSLGEIPMGVSSIDKTLTTAQWRLIADSSYLLISVEEQGGSALGEPSDSIVSKGLCIRLARS